MMYKRTKGQGSTKKDSSAHSESVQRALELMNEGAPPMSLVASPRTRVAELKAIFQAEYPQLDFNTYAPICSTVPAEQVCGHLDGCTAFSEKFSFHWHFFDASEKTRFHSSSCLLCTLFVMVLTFFCLMYLWVRAVLCVHVL